MLVNHNLRLKRVLQYTWKMHIKLMLVCASRISHTRIFNSPLSSNPRNARYTSRYSDSVFPWI